MDFFSEGDYSGLKYMAKSVFKSDAIDLHYILPCNYAVHDVASLPVAVGIFDYITAPKGKPLPFVFSFYIVSQLTINNSQGIGGKKLSFVISDSTGKLISEAVLLLKAPVDKRTEQYNLVAAFNPCEFFTFGYYKLSISLKNSDNTKIELYSDDNFLEVRP